MSNINLWKKIGIVFGGLAALTAFFSEVVIAVFIYSKSNAQTEANTKAIVEMSRSIESIQIGYPALKQAVDDMIKWRDKSEDRMGTLEMNEAKILQAHKGQIDPVQPIKH